FLLLLLPPRSTPFPYTTLFRSGPRRFGIGGREREEEIPGRIARPASEAPEAHSDAAGDALELVRQERRIGRDDHDDGTAAFVVVRGLRSRDAARLRTGRDPDGPGPRQRLRHGRALTETGDFRSNRHAEDPQVSAVIALHE